VNSTLGKMWQNELENWHSSIEYVQEHGGLGVTNHRQEANLVLLADRYMDNDIKTAFRLDWQHMTWDWNRSWTADLERQIHDSLEQNYSTICNLFSHYCGLGEGISVCLFVCLSLREIRFDQTSSWSKIRFITTRVRAFTSHGFPFPRSK
jgi:hypothetical protein